MASRGGAPRTYSIGQVVALAVQPKKSAEATQLPCRILKITEGSFLKALPAHEGFGIPMKADPSTGLIAVGIDVNLSEKWKSLLGQQNMGGEATKKRKRSAEEEEDALAAQEAEAAVVQDELDEQFSRDVEAAVARKDKAKQKKRKLKA